MHGTTMEIILDSLKLLVLYEAVPIKDFAYSRKEMGQEYFNLLPLRD